MDKAPKTKAAPKRIKQPGASNEKPIRTTPREQFVLFAINDRRVYGLEIINIIEQATGGQQKLKVGTLYPILQSLEEKGLIESEWGDENTCGARRKYNVCTNEGKAVIANIQQTQQRLLQGIQPL